jgi:hypothetical protein
MLLTLCLWGISGSIVRAQDPSTGGLVTCGREVTVGKDAKTQVYSCNFAALIAMLNKLITYLIYIAMPLAAIAFAYAGWLYLSAGDNSGQIDKAKKVFTTVGIGFVVILCAWLVFKLIATTFLSDDYKNSTYLE